MESKKAQIGRLQVIVIALMVIGILLGIAFLVMEELVTNVSSTPGSVVNESLIVVNETGTNISAASRCGFQDFIVTQCLNATEGALISTDNYTYSSDGLISFTGADNVAAFNNSNWNCTYSYVYGENACDGLESTITATQKIPTFLSIIVILLIVGILLFIMFRVLPRPGGEA